MLLLAVSGGAPALAQKVYDFDVARGDLGTVVTAIARTSGATVSFPARLARGRMAGPIRTRGSAQDALARALAGSGLEAVPMTGGGLTIRAAADAGPKGATLAGDVERIDVTDVSGGPHHDDGFKAGDAGGTVRIGDAPIKEIPIAVSAVTQGVIQSQGLTNTSDAARNVAGVTVLSEGTTGRPKFQIRGFAAGDRGYTVNGQSQGTFGASMPIDAVERVEVLKGPTSILTGVTANGGLVNVVLKKPTEETIRDLTVRYGTDNRKSLALDMGGLVPGAQNLTYRFVTSGLHADQSDAGYKYPSELLFFPSVKWAGKDLTLSASLNYAKSRIVSSGRYSTLLKGVDPVTGEPMQEVFRVPQRAGFGNPGFHEYGETLTLNAEQSYDAGTILGGIKLKFDNTFEYTRGSLQGSKLRMAGTGPGSTIFDYATSYGEMRNDILTERPSMTLTYEGDRAKSSLKLGYDYQRTISNTDSADGPVGTLDVSTGEPRVPLFKGDPVHFNDSKDVSSGIYAIEKLDLFDNRLHVLGSLRYDWFHDRFIMDKQVNSDSRIDGRSYVLGAAWDITRSLTAYVNHSDGFSPQGMAHGRPIPPEGRRLYEAGLRYSMFDDRLSVTTSVYDLTQTNMTLFNFDTDPVTFIPSAGQRSRGVEVEVQGQVLPGWNVIASATALKAKSLDQQASIDPTSGNPKYQGSLWTTYTLQEGSFLPGLTFGLGARAVSRSETNVGSDGSLFQIKGYMVADAMVGYERGAFSANLKINNIFDQDAIQPTRSTETMFLEPGRNWQLTAKYKF